MGIRYYAYAFDADLTQQAVDDPHSILSSDAPDDGTCYRMFEGNVTMHDMGWDPWVRTILPEEVPSIRDDLGTVDESRVRAWARTWRSRHGADDDDELRYVLDYLKRAQEFVEALAVDGRGMVYLIG